MAVIVECICGRKYEVDPKQVKEFNCETCERRLNVPTEALSKRLQALRDRMTQGEPGLREAAKDAAQLHNPHAIPLLRSAAESGVREAVNSALCGLAEFDGAGTDLIRDWIDEGRLSVSRLASAFRELKNERGMAYLCKMINEGRMKENQIAEIAGFIAETGTPLALETLKAARKKYPNMSPILDEALQKLRHIDATAGNIPDEAKRIPGRESQAAAPVKSEAPPRKGCMPLVLCLLVAAAAAAAAWLL